MKDYIKQFFRALTNDNIDSMSSSVAYAFMLSTFPFLIGIFAILQLLQQSANIVALTLNVFEDILPMEIREFILGNFQNMSYERTGSILAVSLLASLGFGSYGFKTIFIHLSTIMRDARPRSFIWMTILAIVFAAAAMLIIAFSFIMILLSGDIIRFISAKLNFVDSVPLLLNVLRYPSVLIFLVICSAIVYRVGPRRKMPFKSILISSVFFSCGWIIATFIFGQYIGKFAADNTYNLIYGTLAGVIIFLMWSYLSAFIFLSAAEIGRIHMEHHISKAAQSLKKLPEKPEHDKAEEKTGK